MNINYLKYFVDTANERSTGKAAKLNFVSQPAVSQGIKKLEEQLNLDLLVHKRNSIELTHAGFYVLKHSGEVFSSIKSFENKISNYQNEVSGQLRIAVSTSIAKHFLLKKLNIFTKKYPKVDVSIIFGKTSEQINLVNLNKADFGITILDSVTKEMDITTLKNGHFILTGTKKAQDRLLMTESRIETNALLNKINSKKKESFFKDGHVQVQSWSAIKELVSANFGYGLIPDFLIDGTLQNYNSTFDIPPIKYKLSAFKKISSEQSKLQKVFMQHLLQTIS